MPSSRSCSSRARPSPRGPRTPGARREAPGSRPSDRRALGRPRHRSAPPRARAGTETVRRTGRGGRAPAGMETGGRARGQRADARREHARGARRGDERARMKNDVVSKARAIGERGVGADAGDARRRTSKRIMPASLSSQNSLRMSSNAARYRASTDTDAGSADASARDASHASRTALRTHPPGFHATAQDDARSPRTTRESPPSRRPPVGSTLPQEDARTPPSPSSPTSTQETTLAPPTLAPVGVGGSSILSPHQYPGFEGWDIFLRGPGRAFLRRGKQSTKSA